MVVVGVEEGGQGVGALLVAGVGLEVGPFLGQGAVEAFDLAVGLGVVGAGAFVGDAAGGQDVAPAGGGVAGSVVGQDAFDGDSVSVEERAGADPEQGGGGGGLVGQDLAVGEAGVVVDGAVEVAVADAVAFGGLAAVDAPAASVGDVAEFLDVDVDEFAGAGAFVAADDPSGGAVHPGQAVHSVPGEDPVHGGGGHAHQWADPRRAELAFCAQGDHLRLDPGRGAMRRGPWPARPVEQAFQAFGPPPADPLVGGRARDAHLRGDMRYRTPRGDPLDQQLSALERQPGVRVGHTDLRAWCGA
ncbi:hypothetical protein FHU37_000477 [Allostreptomyces psammosilenae]|uniref:Uncharacterized protein n=1 Tax=Allostreptomyces psammosilenae TaxID=1892865 RepID=A0A852ZRP8_9ACTN|nr:hypothetical protein [Allostreptomyces psammosilenae]